MANGKTWLRVPRKAQEQHKANQIVPPAEVDLTHEELLQCLDSLYDDDVQPYGRVLLQRLRERAAVRLAEAQGLEAADINPERMPMVDPKDVRRMCETIPGVTVDSEHGAEFLVLLTDRVHTFVDPLSREECYPDELWEDLAAYFKTLAPATLPGGRYACARWLVAQSLDFLEEYTLGKVCHIVQLAITVRQLLGYSQAHLVPYIHSDEHMKDQCAQKGERAALKKNVSKQLPVASLGEVHVCLRQLLKFEPVSEPGVIVVSNVKRLFRSRFKLELSETALGFSRLHTLLSDESFQDLCTLSLSNGQHVVCLAEANTPRPSPLTWAPVVSLTSSQVGMALHMRCSQHIAHSPTASPTRSRSSTSTVASSGTPCFYPQGNAEMQQYDVGYMVVPLGFPQGEQQTQQQGHPHAAYW